MVRGGQGLAVARELRALSPSAVPETALAAIANLAWRVNQPQIGLRLILPWLKKSVELRTEVDPEIRAEYAGCLLEVGALSESKMMLKDVSRQSPRARFYQALLAFKEWDYGSAVPLLESYLETLAPSYHRFVVQVNLASAYVVNRQLEKAEQLCAALHKELAEKNHNLLLGNSLEIASTIFYQRRQHEKALELLARSEALLSETKNMGWLYCKKWELINHMALARHEDLLRLNHSVEKLTQTAAQMQSWETAREIDFHWALASRNISLLSRVYFGSPMPKYREQVLLRAQERTLDLSEVEGYVFTNESHEPKKIWPMEDLILEDGESLHSWLPKKLLLTLLSDFYAPFRTGNLFSLLFEHEHYDPDSSPDKVFQVVRRLREEIGAKLGLKLDYSDNGYRLTLGHSHGIRVSRMSIEIGERNRAAVYAWILRQRMGPRLISSSDLSDHLGTSTRSSNRVLKELVDQNYAEKLGRGRATRYKLTG